MTERFGEFYANWDTLTAMLDICAVKSESKLTILASAETVKIRCHKAGQGRQIFRKV